MTCNSNAGLLLRVAGLSLFVLLLPAIALASSYRMSSKNLRRARELVEEHQDLIKEKWHDYFGNRG